MAIYHCSAKPVSRSGGRSAVAAIAYRTASLLTNERDGLTHNFTAKKGVVHSEIVLPADVEADWALDRSALWNAAERAERRRDSRVARELEIALPHELSADARLSLARAFAQDLADRYGAAVDFAIHVPQGKSDTRNIHAHLMMTTREVTQDGLGEKTMIERENRWLLANGLPTSHIQMRDIRKVFADHANRHLLEAGLDVRVDHRSHLDRGLELSPTEHMGVHASQMERRGLDVSRARLEDTAAKKNADLIRRKPEEVLRILTDEKSVFDSHDIARTIHRYINDNDGFQRAFAAVMASPQIVELLPEQNSKLAKYSTREMITVEHTMAASSLRMAERNSHRVSANKIDQALDRQDVMLGGSGLTDEQRTAVRHITSANQIAAVIGFAGAGKSTMLSAAREAWEAQGYRVHGAALAGKAAEGLTTSSGIAARTLASWEYGWSRGRNELGCNDILVIDEAGMVASRQLARFVAEAEKRGAKLVLVGDHEQLQAIGAGSPFRAIAERIGSVELTDIRRQKHDWQREASVAFATHRTAEGLRQYAEQNSIRFANDREQACAELIRDYLADRAQNPDGSRIALAHRRVDVRAINDGIRERLQAEGLLAKGGGKAGSEQGHGDATTDREIIYQTVNGKRAFAPGDRIVLLENNRDLGVNNGMLGTVEAVEPNALHLRLDGSSNGQNNARHLALPVKDYQFFDHGYATTIHKAQGATVDRAFVMASATMDRHLTYVAMTRHREAVTLYAGRDELQDMKKMVASMGRSGVKETTLDYEQVFAERRGLKAEASGTNKLEVATIGAKVLQQERAVEQSQPLEQTLSQNNDTPSPLVPAITYYDRTVEEIARDNAMPHLEREIEHLQSMADLVYQESFTAASTFRSFILDGKTDKAELVKAVQERPEQFGALRGKSGLFGDNAERKQALRSAKGLSSHVGFAAETWERRLHEARRSEEWQREKRDIVEVPGLTPKSEAILEAFDQLDSEEKSQFLEQMTKTPEGRQALAEAAEIANALEKRFGTRNRQELEKMDLRLGKDQLQQVDRIRNVARLVERALTAEQRKTYELEQSLKKGLGLGL
ncbi:conjugal transfer protein TraA [Rhizobium sp. Leaf311]|uniref:Ti-type conjugative transfer relaxase TraA n=1 Tax=Rhizobium sp. Leaf311 TaxID=1736332 RepID=UPI0007163A93|nr:Ti-type conjugative transfer relaxase TraA [Rhizobium sp. Leaf311]KQQ59537.1 conjugal transfer protein TraA [Rhizobium sp. Leaf311]